MPMPDNYRELTAHRIVRRVPLAFAAPEGRTYTGYVNPHEKERKLCQCCRLGYSIFAELLHAVWTDPDKAVLMLRCLRSSLSAEAINFVRQEQKRRTDAIRQFERPSDVIDVHGYARAACASLGVPYLCSACNGEGIEHDADLEAKIKAWVPTPPPTGEAYQLWRDYFDEKWPLTAAYGVKENFVNVLCWKYGFSPAQANQFTGEAK